MKPHEIKKTGIKQERKRRGKQRAIKKLNKKGEDNKTLSQKREKGAEKKTWQKTIKRRNRRSRFCHMNC
jgi:hypothetical protein